MSNEQMLQSPDDGGSSPGVGEKKGAILRGGTIPVNVIVRTAHGTPIVNTDVKIADLTDRPIKSECTDENGKAVFWVEPGRYTVSTNAFGKFSTKSIRVTQDDSCLDVKFEVGDGQLVAAPIDLGAQSDFVEAGETLTLTADHYPDDDFTYCWDTTGGSFLDNKRNARVVYLTVPETGNRSIEVTATLTHDKGGFIKLRQNFMVLSASRPDSVGFRRLDLSTPLPVSLQPSNAGPTDDQALWVAIRNRTKAIAFSSYKDFIDRVLCHDLGSSGDNPALLTRKHYEMGMPIRGVAAYELLKVATQAFLLLQCGLVIDEQFYKPSEETSRLGAPVPFGRIKNKLTEYLGGDKLPYIKRIIDATLVELNGVDSPFCNGYLNGRINPCMMELIWSYWAEEGMLVQSINAISLRFQNRRGPLENDPLGHFETSPLRTLNNLVWGYIQDEQHRLTVLRRSHEYKHHYDLALYGKAVGDLRTVDNRSRFLEAYHNLLYLLTVFYKQADDTTFVPDAFPVLNALREVHLELAQGAGNQFGDLPWTARSEMLIQQWLLARPEMREFLQSRPMVPYKEPWMAQVDTMKKLQGWTDCSISTFHDLAVYGEQLLLSIRYGDWVGVTDPAQAANWARYWRPEVQGYIHAYRAATGVDLTASVTDSQQAALRVMQPSALLRQRLQVSSAPALPAPAAPALALSFRERRAVRRTI